MSETKYKSPREIMIKHWIVRMKEVYGIDVDESDFKKEEPGWQFMLKAIEDFHNQHKPSDSEIENELLAGKKFGETHLMTRGAAIECFKQLRDKIFKP